MSRTSLSTRLHATALLLLFSACAGTPEAPRAATTDASPEPLAGPSGSSRPDADIPSDSPIRAQREAAARALDAIAAGTGERTFENTVSALDAVVARFFEDVRMTSFMADVSPDAVLRDRGREADQEMSDWFAEFNKREDLYLAVREFEAKGEELSALDQKLLDETLRDFEREGMGLPVAKRERLLAIDKELNELESDFSKNIADDETMLPFLPEELAGAPQRMLESLPKSGGLVLCEMNGPVIGGLLTYCDSETTRKKAVVAIGRRGSSRNVGLLERILSLRHEKATLLGYANIAAYNTETRMAGSPEVVFNFYEDLRPRLRKKALADFKEYQDAKREHTGDPEAELHPWDISYYKNYLKRTRYAVDSTVLRDYFSMETVTEGLFSITQTIYGLRYEDITEQARSEGRPIWHEDVKLFAVHDKDTGKLLGEFYIDLHPRPNKYSHAAQFPLRLRREYPDGTISTPLVALVCNFTKPTADAPALLSHDEVETYFHEFGHCLHSILTESPYAYFSGTQVARDFVEAPSQMFEEWVWSPTVLNTFAHHYETGEPIPEEILEGMIAARNLGSGLSTEGQVFLGMMDMTYHTDDDGVVDTTTVRAQVYRDTRLFETLPNLWGQASFGHLMGYHAGYYGYQWSLVYAADMAARFKELGLLNPEAGRLYRAKVLSQGGMREELDLVRDFLGREPNSDAYLNHLGLGE